MAVMVKQEEVIKILTRSNKTQVSLSEDMKINPTHLNNVLARRQSASPDFRDNLMKALGVTDWDSLFEVVEAAE